MSTTQDTPEVIVDAQIVDEPRSNTALARREPTQVAIAPTGTVAEVGERIKAIEQLMREHMVEGIDYGKIPGTDKPTLLKPGAEKLVVMFRLDPQSTKELIWDGSHLTVLSSVTIYDQASGTRLGSGEGLCTTHEKKYAKRQGRLVCPECGQPQVNKSKQNDGYYCWAKKGGCGAQFAADDERIRGQDVGEVENPDLADQWNTAIKMAKKRALIDAVLITTSASAIFTQDLEEHGGSGGGAVDATVATDDAPYGHEVDQGTRTSASRALTRLFDGNPEDARHVWDKIRQHCGGFMPQAAALAILVIQSVKQQAASNGDERQAASNGGEPQPEAADGEPVEPGGELIAALEDEALNLLKQLFSEKTALKKVNDAAGNPNVLAALISTAKTALAKKAAQEARS